MMFHGQGFSRNRCIVVAVVCGEQKAGAHQPNYPFPDLSSSGRLKVKDFFLLLLFNLFDTH